MSTAYTPGLTVTQNTLIRKTRRLPIKGEVLITAGQNVEPHTILARTELPGPVTTLRVAEQLGVEPAELKRHLRVQEGDTIEQGQILGEVKTFFGMFTSKSQASASGTVEFISDVTGNIGIRHQPTPVELPAYIHGRVSEVLEGEGAIVETTGAFVQGIFGIGGERQGTLKAVAAAPDEIVAPEKVGDDCRDCVLVLGGQVTHAALQQALERGAAGVVAGGIVDEDLRKVLGYDIGVAITGRESLPLTVIITEGFGNIPMAERTFQLLQSLAGQKASVNGATQIRAGVIRPEVIVSQPEQSAISAVSAQETDLREGVPIRLIREPYFGALATVSGLPSEPQQIETGAVVRVLEAQLRDGARVTVPRANVEIIATG